MRAPLLLLLLAPLLSACIAAPEPPPVPSAPAAWQSAPAGARAAWPSPTWWTAFGDPALNGVIAEVEAANPDLAVAGQRLLQAEARARIADSSLFPTVDFRANQSASRVGSRGGEAYGLSLGAAYEIDLWGRYRALADSARALAQASRYDWETVAISVTANSVNAYHQVLILRERLALARQSLATSERILAYVTSRVREGGASQIDLRAQQALVLGQRATLPSLMRQELDARVTLATLMGRPVQALRVKGDAIPVRRLKRVAPGLPSQLLLRRPDVRRAESDLVAAGANLYAARAAMLPQIGLTGSLGFQSAALGSLLSGSSFVGAVGSALAQTVFDAGRRAAETDIAESTRIERLVQYRTAINDALSDTEAALGALQRLTEQEALLARQVAELRQVLTLAEERYRAGADDLLKLLDAQRSLTSVQDQHAQVRGLRIQAYVGLVRALGGGWSEAAAEITALQVAK